MSNGSHDDAPVPIYHYFWTQQAQDDPADSVVRSPLLRLTRTSHVNQIRLEQVSDARDVLKLRRKLWSTARSDGSRVVDSQSLRSLQRRLVERFLADRNTYFGPSQCAPLDCVSELVDEGRDIFVIVKFMDEAPHIRATFLSLLNQRNIEPGRIVIIAVDNNSTDGSREVVQGLIEESETAVRLIYLNQAMPGAGHAARLGVDRAIATLHAMCQLDEDWQRLQTAVIAVSDGDTVYQPNVMSDSIKILEADPTVDGVMPFLIYKSAAALRLFARYYDYRIDDVRSRAVDCEPVPVPISLSTAEAYEVMPRWQRRLVGEQVELWVADEGLVAVPLKAVDQHGRRFGVIRDAVGHTGFVFEDRSVILTEAPVSGFDAALVFLENGDIGATEKWRWHSLIGLDIFLYWAFAGMGMPEEMVYPDTSDALKMLRAWSFAIGGQHQLADVGLRIATGSDYQSGRVLQAVGCAVRLGPARAFAETEPDRLIKMVRNLANHQSVFYGDTRGAPLDRATGLYIHMTRIQAELEAELLSYSDVLFEDTIFPERLLFPMRWILQNAVRFYAHPQLRAKQMVRERVLRTMFGDGSAKQVEKRLLSRERLSELIGAPDYERQSVAEDIAERIMVERHDEIMMFYERTLRSFFVAHQVAGDHYEWLLAGVTASPSAARSRPANVAPAAVWESGDFVIDIERGQAVQVRKTSDDS